MPTDFAKTAGSKISWYSSEVAFAKFLVLLNFLAENPQKQQHLFFGAKRNVRSKRRFAWRRRSRQCPLRWWSYAFSSDVCFTWNLRCPESKSEMALCESDPKKKGWVEGISRIHYKSLSQMLWYCWWQQEILRSPVEVGSLYHYLQGFIHPKCCRISAINSMIQNCHTSTFTWIAPLQVILNPMKILGCFKESVPFSGTIFHNPIFS